MSHFIKFVAFLSIALASTHVTAQSADTVDELNDKGFAKLHYAAMQGNLQRAKELIAAGADVGIQQGKFQGQPLQYASAKGHIEVVRLLLESGAKTDSVDSRKRTPLMWATNGSHAEVAKLLIEYNADINAENYKGWTPLTYARKVKCEPIIKQLMRLNAAKERQLPYAPNDDTLKARNDEYAETLAKLRIVAKDLPDGISFAKSAVYLHGKSQTDQVMFDFHAKLIGKPANKPVGIEAIVVTVYHDKESKTVGHSNEIGVVAYQCVDESVARSLHRPPVLVQSGKLLLYIWKDSVRQEAFDSVKAKIFKD